MLFILSLKKTFSLERERSYYKIDIVDKYNEYKMAIVPEEVIDLPAIGFVECMACGCAYIGVPSSMYENVGMISGIHYIGYDGTVADLVNKINYYQNHPDELSVIASNGYKFVRGNIFNEQVAMDKLIGYLNTQILNRNNKF